MFSASKPYPDVAESAIVNIYDPPPIHLVLINIKRIITIEDGIPRDLDIEMTEMMAFVNKHLEIARKSILVDGKAEALKGVRFYEKEINCIGGNYANYPCAD